MKVKLGRIPATKVTFPAVTVCNTNPIKNSLVGLSPLLSEVLQDKRRKRRDTGGGIGREKRSKFDLLVRYLAVFSTNAIYGILC